MQLKSQGLIVNRRDFGESDLILHIFSEHYGSMHGLVKRGRTSKESAIHQIGNIVSFVWQSRLESQLGTIRAELLLDYAARLSSKREAVYALVSVCSLLAIIFPKAQPQDDMYTYSAWLLMRLQDATVQQWIKDYLHWEIKLLQVAGYGLSLGSCAVTGAKTGLCYMSPKTGAVVTRTVGQPYAQQLLPVPEFLHDASIVPTYQDLRQAFSLLSYFLQLHFPETKNNLARETVIGDVLIGAYTES